MLFHSQVFILLFLPLTLMLYYKCYEHIALRHWVLITASAIFYMYWNVYCIALLGFSVVINWLLSNAYSNRKQKWIPVVGILLNLSVLGVFKYANFFGESWSALSGKPFDAWNIILPLGISFFTFQQISYLVDLKNDKAPLYKFREYCLYVTFFPQLIAGPIVRHNEIIPQFNLSPQKIDLAKKVSQGIALFIIGVIKKVMIGDYLAKIADPLFVSAQTGDLSFFDSWIAALAFTLQIYFDFSGYTDMALGLGLMFGLSLPINFAAPYRATSIIEFWRRWHITLSLFLRDYLYFPLGGSRYGMPRQVINLMITMLLGGLWHGASWTFVAWGGCHGLALAVNHLWKRTGFHIPQPLAWGLTFLTVVSTFVLFRSPDFSTALQ